MDDLKLLSKRLAGLLIKRPGLVVGLWGEPGIGKTHTTKRLLRETPCRSLSLHASVGAEDLAQALPRPDRLPNWAERTLERASKREHVEPSNLTDALGALLSGLAPYIVHLEDLHEMNPEQLKFAQSLARTVKRLKGVGLIATTREPPPEGFEALRLGPLSVEETQRMLNNVIGAPLPADAFTWIHGRSAGNPLFTLEFFHLLARQGFVWNDGWRWHWRTPERNIVPVTIEALIEQVTARAASSPALEDAIHAKAVLGRGISAALWAEVAGLAPEVWREATQALGREGLLSGEEFAHPLYPEVIARRLPTARRQALARRALAALGDDPEAATAFVKDAGLDPETALGLFQRAARAAKNAGNEMRAARLLAQAADYASGELQGRLALEAARTMLKADATVAGGLAERAASVLTDNTEAIWVMSEALGLQGRREEMHCALERLPARERIGPGWVFRLIGLCYKSGDSARALALWHEHPALHPICDPTSAHYVAYTLLEHAEPQAAQALATRMLAQAGLSTLQRADLMTVCGDVHFFEGRYEEAERLMTDGLALYRACGENTGVANALRNRAVVRLQRGLYQDTIPDFESAMRIYSDLSDAIRYAQTQIMASYVRIELGDYEQTEELLTESLSVFSRIDPQAFIVHAQANLSDLYLLWNPPHGTILAQKYAEDALRSARDLNIPVLMVIALFACARAETGRGNAATGLELAEEALARVSGIGQVEGLMSCHLARGLALAALGRDTEALESLRRAEAIGLENGLVLETHKAGLEIARLTQDVRRAREALGWFEERGLQHGASLAVRYFPELAPAAGHIVAPAARLEILGPMRYVSGGSSLPVRGQKRRELLAQLVNARIAGQRQLSRLELIDALSPGVDETQGGVSLKNIVYQLRELCGPNTVLTTADGYALGAVASDAEVFLETGDTRLWRGAYLEGTSLDRPNLNETVRERLHLALYARAERLIETDPTEASRVGRLLCEADPYDLECLNLRLRALRAVRNHKSLTRTYAQAREQFLEIGEALPERWQDFFETRIGITA